MSFACKKIKKKIKRLINLYQFEAGEGNKANYV